MARTPSPTRPEACLLPWRERAFVQLGMSAEILGVSQASVYNLEAKGQLAFRRVAGRTVVSVESLAALIDSAEPWTASDRGADARASRRMSAREAGYRA